VSTLCPMCLGGCPSICSSYFGRGAAVRTRSLQILPQILRQLPRSAGTQLEQPGSAGPPLEQPRLPEEFGAQLPHCPATGVGTRGPTASISGNRSGPGSYFPSSTVGQEALNSDRPNTPSSVVAGPTQLLYSGSLATTRGRKTQWWLRTTNFGSFFLSERIGQSQKNRE